MHRAGHNVGMFREWVGDVWDTLPEGLRASHTIPGEADGTVRVMVRGGLFGGCLNHLLGLPCEGHTVRVHLKMTPTAGGSLWERSFDGRPLLTLMQIREGQVTETVGATAIDYDVVFQPDKVTYMSKDVRWHGRLLAVAVRPKVHAIVTPREGGWYVDVRFSLPLFGLLCHYEGEMRPT